MLALFGIFNSEKNTSPKKVNAATFRDFYSKKIKSSKKVIAATFRDFQLKKKYKSKKNNCCHFLGFFFACLLEPITFAHQVPCFFMRICIRTINS